jgi:endonuclease YncB( thermonuclease family)
MNQIGSAADENPAPRNRHGNRAQRERWRTGDNVAVLVVTAVVARTDVSILIRLPLDDAPEMRAAK